MEADGADDGELRLRVPPAIPVVLLGFGVVWGLPLIVALVGGGGPRPLWQVANALVTAGLVAFGLDTALIGADVRADAVVLRRWGRTRRVDRDDVRGISLDQDGGVPRLRVVVDPRGGGPSVPAWSLRARHADGEHEAAGPALLRWGGEHGVRVRHRGLTGPVT